VITRRLVLTGLLAAPLVVKAASLMVVRGVVMPVRGFFWGKQQSQWADYHLGVAGEEPVGVIVPFDQPDFERCTMEEEAILDRMRALVTAHGEDGAVVVDRLKRFPLGIQRISYDARYGAAYVEDQVAYDVVEGPGWSPRFAHQSTATVSNRVLYSSQGNAVPTWRGPA
jgi:hypothetical protein